MTDESSLEKDRRELQDLLQFALMVELSTIPPYATACYSIKEQGQYDRSSPEIVNAEPIEVIRQVMVEEMLHMVLVANVMNAIGFSPILTDPDQLPKYPRRLLIDRGPELRLRRFDRDQINGFREVERAVGDPKKERDGPYNTIGGLYLFIVKRLQDACNAHGAGSIFIGDDSLQIDDGDYYGAGGVVIPVTDLISAISAITEIMEEGEGADLGKTANDGDRIPGPPGEDRMDVAHYFKFNEILHSRYYQPKDLFDAPPSAGDMIVDWSAVCPMRDDPKSGDYVGWPDIQALSDSFNASYSELLYGLELAFSGKKDQLRALVPVMYQLRDRAQKLMRVPLPGVVPVATAGPTWDYIGPRHTGNPGKDLARDGSGKTT
jgi:hypothetical protein